MLIFPYLVSLIIRATANITSTFSARAFSLSNLASDSLIPSVNAQELSKNQTVVGSAREETSSPFESSEAYVTSLVREDRSSLDRTRGIFSGSKKFRIPSFKRNTDSADDTSSSLGTKLNAKHSKKSKKSKSKGSHKIKDNREKKQDRIQYGSTDTGLDDIAFDKKPSEVNLSNLLEGISTNNEIVNLESERLIESLKDRLQSIKPLLSAPVYDAGFEVQFQHGLASSGGKHRKGLGRKIASPLLSTVVIAALLLLVILSICVAIYITKIFLNEMNRAISNGYTEFIEKQAAVRKISAQQLKRYRSTVWSRSNEPNEAAEKKPWSFVEDFSGSRIYFFNKEVAAESFVCNHSFSRLPSLEPDVPGIYYEIEVEYLHDQSALIIGISDLLDLLEIRKGKFPGNTLRSVGFNIKTGEVFMGNTIAHKFDIAEIIKMTIDADTSRLDDPAGNFYGIGFIFDLGLFFFTFNGRILNSLSYQALGEANTKLYLLKKHEMIEQNESVKKAGDIMKFINHLDLKKTYRDEIKRIPQFKSINEELHPVIYLAGAAKFFVNVGAAPFQVKDVSIQTGLLGSP